MGARLTHRHEPKDQSPSLPQTPPGTTGRTHPPPRAEDQSRRRGRSRPSLITAIDPTNMVPMDTTPAPTTNPGPDIPPPPTTTTPMNTTPDIPPPPTHPPTTTGQKKLRVPFWYHFLGPFTYVIANALFASLVGYPLSILPGMSIALVVSCTLFMRLWSKERRKISE